MYTRLTGSHVPRVSRTVMLCQQRRFSNNFNTQAQRLHSLVSSAIKDRQRGRL
jgi:hypothetical protein